MFGTYLSFMNQLAYQYYTQTPQFLEGEVWHNMVDGFNPSCSAVEKLRCALQQSSLLLAGHKLG